MPHRCRARTCSRARCPLRTSRPDRARHHRPSRHHHGHRPHRRLWRHPHPHHRARRYRHAHPRRPDHRRHRRLDRHHPARHRGHRPCHRRRPDGRHQARQGRDVAGSAAAEPTARCRGSGAPTARSADSTACPRAPATPDSAARPGLDAPGDRSDQEGHPGLPCIASFVAARSAAAAPAAAPTGPVIARCPPVHRTASNGPNLAARPTQERRYETNPQSRTPDHAPTDQSACSGSGQLHRSGIDRVGEHERASQSAGAARCRPSRRWCCPPPR